MNNITKISSILPLMCSLLLIATLSACSGDKTASDAPIAIVTNAKPTPDNTQIALSRKQLNAESKALNPNRGGDSQKRGEGDLASEVRSILEAKIPGGKLTVTVQKADVTVSGEVTTQEQLNKIKPLAMGIKGVHSVVVKAICLEPIKLFPQMLTQPKMTIKLNRLFNS